MNWNNKNKKSKKKEKKYKNKIKFVWKNGCWKIFDVGKKHPCCGSNSFFSNIGNVVVFNFWVKPPTEDFPHDFNCDLIYSSITSEFAKICWNILDQTTYWIKTTVYASSINLDSYFPFPTSMSHTFNFICTK